MSRLILYVLTTSQILGGIQAFSIFDAQLRQAPVSTLDTAQTIFLGIAILVYLLGFIGAILILAGTRGGFTLSALHQLLLIPVVVNPGHFVWVLEDFGYFVVFLLHRAGEWTGQYVFVFGISGITAVLQPAPDTGYFGVNFVAVLFLISLLVIKRETGLLIGRPGETVSIRRWLFDAIGLLQIFTALIAIPALLTGGQSGAITARLDDAWFLFNTAVYLAGLLGGIFLVVEWQAGIWLSIVHQSLCVPFVLLASQQVAYGIVSILNFVIYVAKVASVYTFGFIATAHLDLRITFPTSGPDAVVIGVNLVALFCVIYLYAMRGKPRASDVQKDESLSERPAPSSG